MNILAIDYGAKRVGVAVSRHDIAFPHGVLPNNGELISHIARLVEEGRLEKIIVGDTRSFGGHENSITHEATAFVEALRTHVSVPVETAIEMGSSIEASRYAPQGEEHNDAAAAAVILQRYIDMNASTVH